MSNITISVPITREQERFLKEKVRRGIAANKAHAVRQALDKVAEDDAVNAVLEAEREIAEGQIFYGDLDKLARKIR